MTGFVGVYGAGGAGRGLLPIAREQFPNSECLFVEDGASAGLVNGARVLGFEEAVELDVRVCIAVSDCQIRRALAEKCHAAGLSFETLMSPHVTVMDDVKWGEGSAFSPYCSLTSNIRIGSHFQCNLYSYVEHDCRIGDFVTFGPGVRCNGNVTIGHGAYVGSGAMIRQGLTIGEGATVGMGAVVIDDVAAGSTVVGNPARILAR